VFYQAVREWDGGVKDDAIGKMTRAAIRRRLKAMDKGATQDKARGGAVAGLWVARAQVHVAAWAAVLSR